MNLATAPRLNLPGGPVEQKHYKDIIKLVESLVIAEMTAAFPSKDNPLTFVNEDDEDEEPYFLKDCDSGFTCCPTKVHIFRRAYTFRAHVDDRANDSVTFKGEVGVEIISTVGTCECSDCSRYESPKETRDIGIPVNLPWEPSVRIPGLLPDEFSIDG